VENTSDRGRPSILVGMARYVIASMVATCLFGAIQHLTGKPYVFDLTLDNKDGTKFGWSLVLAEGFILSILVAAGSACSWRRASWSSRAFWVPSSRGSPIINRHASWTRALIVVYVTIYFASILAGYPRAK